MSYIVGDRVRVSIPDPDDPDHRYHDEVGTIVSVSTDDLGGITGDVRDNRIYQVEFDDKAFGTMTFRHHNLRRL